MSGKRRGKGKRPMRNEDGTETLSTPGHDEHYRVRDAINAACRAVRENAPTSRERSLVITHLETARLWAAEMLLNGQDARPPGDE